jgi:hypothetical protein
LSGLGYPKEEIIRLINLCKSIPKLNALDLIKEGDRDIYMLPGGKMNPNHIEGKAMLLDTVEVPKELKKVFEELTITEGGMAVVYSAMEKGYISNPSEATVEILERTLDD